MTSETVLCPACGTGVTRPATGGGRPSCPTCGKRIDTAAVHPPAADGCEATEAADDLAAAAARAGPAPARAGRRRSPSARAVVLPVVAAALASAATAVVFVGGRPAPPASSTAGRPDDAVTAKLAADAAVLRGDLRAAYDGYGRVLALTATTAANDPAAAELTAAVRARQDQVFAAMARPAPAPSPAPVVAATTTPPAAAAVADRPLTPVDPTPEPVTDVRPVAAVTPPAADPTDAALAAVDAAPPLAGPFAAPALHAHTRADAVTDDQIGRAILLAIDNLRQHGPSPFVPAAGPALPGPALPGAGIGVDPQPGYATNPQGPYLLAAYSLLHATQATDPTGGRDPAVGQLLDQIKTFPLSGTYSRSLRAAALAVYARPADRQALEADVAWLVAVQRAGAYTYGVPTAAGGYRPPVAGGGVVVTGVDTGSSLPPLAGAGGSGGDGTAPPASPPQSSLPPAVYPPPPFPPTATTPRAGFVDHCTPGRGPLIRPRPGVRAGDQATPPTTIALSGTGTGLDPTQPTNPTNPTVPAETYDNSNSQYGLLGVWSGAQAGVPVPAGYWQAVQGHWVRDAQPDGTWGYRRGPGGGYLSMTLAGVASMLVTRDYLDTPASATVLRKDRSPQLAAGLAYLDAGDNCLDDHGKHGYGFPAYSLYGLERVGLASGYKYFGDHDWYAEVARQLVAAQQGDGGWGTDPMNTSYFLLFLSRGRHPILFNKLRYAGDWDDRPGDVSHLARFASRQLERPLNWQVVNLRRDWSDWLDAPVLYVSGDAAPALTDHDYDALRDYALGGGLIFTHADNGSPAFNAWARQMAARCFPAYELTAVQKAHPLNAAVFHLKNPPPLQAVSNGSRALMIHSPTDLAGGWQMDWTADKRAAFEAGVNVFAYAAGTRGLNNRLASSYVPAPPGQPSSTRTVARLRYAGEWDPEPYAWTRFGRQFQWETGGALASEAVDLKALTPGAYPAAFLTGTVRQDFTPAEAAAARAYVEAGGVLVIDACGGQAAFDKSVRESLLTAAFPESTPAPLSADHPALVPSRPGADDLRQPMPTRPYVQQTTGTNQVPVEGFRSGRGWVIYSKLDLTTGLLGTNTSGVLGYEPAYAEALVKNLVLWADARTAALSTVAK